MTTALDRHLGPTTVLGPLDLRPRLTTKLWAKATMLATGRRYKYEQSRDLARRSAVVFDRRLAETACDMVFAPVASPQIAGLEYSGPVVYATDATFELLRDQYDNFANLSRRSVREGHDVERRAIHRSDLLLYPSQWAARSAIEDYGADPRRVLVTPYGANLDPPPSREAVLAREAPPRCTLLFLAREWARKGGDLVLATLADLARRGVDAEVVVCGVDPPPGVSRDRLRVVPFLDKNVPEDRQRLSELLTASTFLFVPTRADCFPIVFCEASAHGLPVITTDVGGVGEAVRTGENGVVLPIEAGAADYAEVIESICRDGDGYRRLVVSTREAFDAHLNWDAWGRDVASAMRHLLA